MQPYDIVMVVVLVGATLFGFWKGMAWQIASLASLVLSTFVALRFGKALAPFFGEHEPWNQWIAMLVLFVATALAIWLVFRLVSGAIDRVRLKEFDRQIGALFGLVKGVLLCVLITFFVVMLSESGRQTVLGSQSGRYIAVLIRNATPVLPEEITSRLGGYISEFDKKLDPNTPADTSGSSILPDLSDDELENLAKDVFGDMKQGLDSGGDRLKEGVDGQLDNWQDQVNRAVDDKQSEMQHETSYP
jgi:membrane protein required for colicin V production